VRGGALSESEDISIIDEVDRLASQQPFVPFVIVMSSGREYDVTGDVNVATGRSTLSLFASKGGYFVLQRSQISEVIVDREKS